jgi:hypothetical protein
MINIGIKPEDVNEVYMGNMFMKIISRTISNKP